MQIALLLFDGMTALDAIGPIQVLSALPGAAVRTVSSTPGAKRTDAGVTLVAEHALADVPSPDIVLIPGGMNMQPVMADARVLEWLRAVHSTTTWTTSVCTGALVLGAAPEGGPGPLVTHFSGAGAGQLPCPLYVIPGSLDEATIDRLS